MLQVALVRRFFFVRSRVEDTHQRRAGVEFLQSDGDVEVLLTRGGIHSFIARGGGKESAKTSAVQIRTKNKTSAQKNHVYRSITIIKVEEVPK